MINKQFLLSGDWEGIDYCLIPTLCWQPIRSLWSFHRISYKFYRYENSLCTSIFYAWIVFHYFLISVEYTMSKIFYNIKNNTSNIK